MEVSLVIPCFNEEGNIENLINKCEKFLSDEKNQLVLVNNGSSDNTEKKLINTQIFPISRKSM